MFGDEGVFFVSSPSSPSSPPRSFAKNAANRRGRTLRGFGNPMSASPRKSRGARTHGRQRGRFCGRAVLVRFDDKRKYCKCQKPGSRRESSSTTSRVGSQNRRTGEISVTTRRVIPFSLSNTPRWRRCLCADSRPRPWRALGASQLPGALVRRHDPVATS